MKVFLCSLAILLVAICLPCQAKPDITNKCKAEAGVTNEIKEGQKLNYEDPKVKCFVTCWGKEAGYILDGQVIVEKLMRILSKIQELDDAKKEYIQGCAKEANKLSGCEVGPAVIKCLKEKKIKLNKNQGKDISKECRKKIGITDEIKEGQKLNYKDPKVKCFVTCWGKEAGYILDGQVIVEKLMRILSKIQELDDAKKEYIQGCAKEANKLSGCEVGPAVIKCLKEKKIKLNKNQGKSEAAEYFFTYLIT